MSIDELNISMEPMAYSSNVNINSFASEIMERETKKLKKEMILFPNLYLEMKNHATRLRKL